MSTGVVSLHTGTAVHSSMERQPSNQRSRQPVRPSSAEQSCENHSAAALTDPRPERLQGADEARSQGKPRHLD